MTTYIAFLRGINVSGHHKVPMAELRTTMETLKCKRVQTLLNSGNLIFESETTDLKQLEKGISTHLEQTFGFPIPTILRKAATLVRLLKNNPFKDIELNKDLRFYVSFLRKDPEGDLKLPWQSDDQSFKIMSLIDGTVISVLDLSIGKTPKALAAFEKFFGKEITTRNWNTIKRIEKKLKDNE